MKGFMSWNQARRNKGNNLFNYRFYVLKIYYQSNCRRIKMRSKVKIVYQ